MATLNNSTKFSAKYSKNSIQIFWTFEMACANKSTPSVKRLKFIKEVASWLTPLPMIVPTALPVKIHVR